MIIFLRKQARRNACPTITLCSCQAFLILRPHGWKGGHRSALLWFHVLTVRVASLSSLRLPACSICHLSLILQHAALPPPAPAPAARNNDVLHGLAESETPPSHRCVHAVPFLGGTQLASATCTHLALSLTLEKTKVLGFEMSYGFNHLKDV